MTNDDFERPEDLDDPMTIGAVEDHIAAGNADSYADLRDFVNYLSRDHARTPMQWSDDEHAGFTTNEPWLDVNENYPEINVEAARADEDSIWHHYRRLVDLRHEEDVLVYGEYDLLCPEDEQVFAYTRTLGDERMLIVLNWSEASASVDLGHADARPDRTDPSVRLSNYEDTATDPEARPFRPYEAAVYRC